MTNKVICLLCGEVMKPKVKVLLEYHPVVDDIFQDEILKVASGTLYSCINCGARIALEEQTLPFKTNKARAEFINESKKLPNPFLIEKVSYYFD